MGLWKDKASGTWKFKFQMDGKGYGGGGHKQILTSGSGQQTPIDMGFREAASMYLDRNKRRKKFKIFEIGGIPGVMVSSWEEEQEARSQGHQNIYYSEKSAKKKRTKKKKWLSGRSRYDRNSGIFDVK